MMDEDNDQLRNEYKKQDLGQGVRGKYYSHAQVGTNLIVLDPDLIDVFPNSEAVNAALRALKSIADRAAQRGDRG